MMRPRRRAHQTTIAAIATVAAVAMALGCSTSATGGADQASGGTPAATDAPATTIPVEDPSVRGTSPVGYLELSATDPSRNRTLPVSVWYPAATTGTVPAAYKIVADFAAPAKNVWTSVPVAGGAHPVVLFSHGNGGTRFQSSFITETLASHGFIVAALDHTGNTLNDPHTIEAMGQSTADRPKDIPVLIDDLLRRNADAADPLHGAIDPDRIGMSGHSLGGYTTVAAAAGSGYGDPPERRLKAIAPLAPAVSLIPEDKVRALSIPTLLMGGALDTSAPPPIEVMHAYDLVGSPTKFRVVINEGNHYVYTDMCNSAAMLSDPSVPPGLAALAKSSMASNCDPPEIAFDQGATIINRYLVAFFETYLAGDQRYQQYLAPVDGVTFAGSR